MANRLYYGDNLHILREHVADQSVDLVYLDPPFNSNASYNVLFRAPGGEESRAQIEAFDDTWHWNQPAEDAYWQVLHGPNTEAARMLEAMRGFLGDNDMMAYLAMMAVRLIELHRVLKPTGSLYLHCDPTASHYLKILLDAVFGPRNFMNEVIWKRASAHSSSKRFSPVHDVLLFYAKTERKTWNKVLQPIPQETLDAWYNNVEEVTGRRFNRADITAAGKRSGPSGKPWRGIDPSVRNRHWAIPGYLKLGTLTTQEALDILDEQGRLFWPKKADGMPMFKRYLDESPGVPALDIISDIPPLNNVAKERLGYPTQKPVALLERIIAASSNEGDVVLDPFCGCGTTVHAAEKLGRRWIGIDITHLAISLVERRLKEAFPGIRYQVIGVPKDIGAAEALAAHDRHEFEKWAITLIPDAQPWRGGRKGADTGIDGIVYLRTGKSASGKAIIEVKSGAVGVDQVHKLKSVVEREGALTGIFITLKPPTRQMQAEAAAAGYSEIDIEFGGGGKETARLPKVQILTVAQLLDGARPKLPMIDSSVFKRAKREVRTTQQTLDL